MVVDVRAVDPFHVSGGMLVVHGLRGVGGEGGLPAHLAYLARVPLHMVDQKTNHPENIKSMFKNTVKSYHQKYQS